MFNCTLKTRFPTPMRECVPDRRIRCISRCCAGSHGTCSHSCSAKITARSYAAPNFLGSSAYPPYSTRFTNCVDGSFENTCWLCIKSGAVQGLCFSHCEKRRHSY